MSDNWVAYQIIWPDSPPTPVWIQADEFVPLDASDYADQTKALEALDDLDPD